MRSELTPAQVSEFMYKRKCAYERLHPEAKHGGDRRPTRQVGGLVHSFAADTAGAIGISKRAVNKQLARGERIAPDVLAEIKTDPSLDKSVVLDMVAKAPRGRTAWENL